MTSTRQVAVDPTLSYGLASRTGGPFSIISTQPTNTRVVSRSTLNLPGDIVDASFAYQREVVLSAAINTDAATSLAFTGTGSVTGPGGQYSISSSVLSLPDPVPYDQGLVRFSVSTSNAAHSVTLFVGTVDGLSDVMRVCWRYDIPGALRVACTRHAKATGSLVGADSQDDLSGTIYSLQAEVGDGFVPSALRCTHTRAYPVSDGYAYTYSFGVYAFDASIANGGLFPAPSSQYAMSVSLASDGTTEYRLEPGPGVYGQTHIAYVSAGTISRTVWRDGDPRFGTTTCN